MRLIEYECEIYVGPENSGNYTKKGKVNIIDDKLSEEEIKVKILNSQLDIYEKENIISPIKLNIIPNI